MTYLPGACSHFTTERTRLRRFDEHARYGSGYYMPEFDGVYSHFWLIHGSDFRGFKC